MRTPYKDWPEEKKIRNRLMSKRSREKRRIRLGLMSRDELKAAGMPISPVRSWSIMSPAGVAYRFKSLPDFIKKNPFLFNEDDLIPRNKKGDKGRAIVGIQNLRPTNRKSIINGSWKGWTWITLDERANNNSEDILNRKTHRSIGLRKY